jgi:AhpD family alkylhydroperoxidase
MVPNFFRTLGHAPAVLSATLAFDDALNRDLSPRLRELAYLKCSELNRCEYSLHYHQAAARQAGLTPAQISDLANYAESGAYSALEKAVIRFAEQWTTLGRVEAEVLTELSQGLTPTQLVTLAATVGQANWSDRLAATFGIELP